MKKETRAVGKTILLLALCMVLLTGCGQKETPAPKALSLTDGYFEAVSDGLTWTCVLKESGIYYFQSITGAVAGTWKEVDEEISYIANFSDGDSKDETVPNKDNPEYKTTNRCIVLAQFNGGTQKVAYADGRLWNVSADFGMSTRNLTQKDAEWDAASERSVTVMEFYAQKDITQSVQFTHNYEFRDFINGISGTWAIGADENTYTLSVDGKAGTLTVQDNGASAVYTLEGETVTLYKTSISPVYEFTGEAYVTLVGQEEPSALDFNLALYDNGDGETYNGDADLTFYDEDYNEVLIDSGRYVYDQKEGSITFSGFKTDANNMKIQASVGAFTYIFTDAEENGLFEKVSAGPDAGNVPVTVSLTYNLPAAYTLTAALPEGADAFASVEMFENAGDAGSVKLTKLTLEILENGEAYIRSELTLGETLSAAVGGIQKVNGTLAEGTVKESAGNMMTLNLGGAEIKTFIDRENGLVKTDAYKASDLNIGMGSPIQAVTGDQTISLSDVVFSMKYVPASAYEFKSAGEYIFSAVQPDDPFMPAAVFIRAMDDESYQIIQLFQNLELTAQTGTWTLSEDGASIAFVPTDADSAAFTAEKSNGSCAIHLENLEIGTGVNLPTDYGTLTGDFVCKSGNSLLATLNGKSIMGGFGTLSAMNGTITGKIDGLSLLLYTDGSVEMQAVVSFDMLAAAGSIPGGLVDRGTYTVDDDVYAFAFEGAGQMTGTVTDGALHLMYTPGPEAQLTYTAPDYVAAYFTAAGTISAESVRGTFSGTVQ